MRFFIFKTVQSMPSLPNQSDVANNKEWHQVFEWRQVEYDLFVQCVTFNYSLLLIRITTLHILHI